MKKFLPTLVGVLAIAYTQPSHAQAPCDVKGIATDPAQPAANSEYPARTNTFNWYTGQQYSGRWWNLNNAAINESAIWLPWEQTDNTSVTHILGKRDYPKDGWELLKRDLGYDDGGAPVVGSRNPYVVLYNKRSGMLRVFVAMGDLFNSYQFAEIKLRFADRAGGASKKAGTLNRLEGIGTALENTVPGTASSFVAMAPFLNQRAKWFMADFPMEYDPCVCQFDSKFVIEVNLISQADVKLQGVTTGTLVTTDVNKPGATQTDGDYSQSATLMKKASSAVSAGQKTYNSLNSFASSVKGKLTVQGAKSDAADATAKKDAVDKLTAALAKSDFLKAGLKALPYIGAAVSALDAFFGGGKEESTPAPIALQPMTIEMNTTTTGTITAANLYTNITFNNPGTRTITTREEYPYYNEAMGVFSLLTRPTVEYRNVVYRDANDVSSRRFEFKVPQALQYVINPASGLEVQDFQVALVQNANEYYPEQLPAGWLYEGMAAHTTGEPTHVFRTDYVDAGCLASKTFTLSTKDPRFQTQSEVVIAPGATTTFLKFILNLRRPGAPATEQNTLVVLKYPVMAKLVTTFTATSQPCVPILPQATTATVQSFCNSALYSSAVNLRTAALAPAAAPATPVIADSHVYPNPTAGQATLSFSGQAAGYVTAYLTDVVGHKVLTIMQHAPVVAGEQHQSFSTSGLAPGLYYCVVETSEGRRVASSLSVVR